jgi:pimeloyl-ACP methyl ester carboxylesterase
MSTKVKRSPRHWLGEADVTAPIGWPLPETYAFEGQAIRWGRMGEGAPLVLFHGTPFSSYEWHRVAPHLARVRTVYCYDMLGYGASEKRAGQDVSLGVQNAVAAGLFAHWGLTAPDVLAHDFGGATALRAHLLDGLDYRTLTLIDPVALAPWGSPLVGHVREHEAAFAEMPAYMHDAILPAYLRSAMHRKATDETLAPYMAPWQGAENQRAFYRQIAQMDQRYTDEIAPRLGAMRCPVRVLWGEDDAWLPIAQGRDLAGRMPGAVFHAVPQCGHLMQEDAPEAIVAHVLAFLAAVRA